MPVHFFCQKCNEELLVEDIHAGKQVRCPRCSSVLVVPTSSSVPKSSFSQYNPNTWQQENIVSSNPYEMPHTENELDDPTDPMFSALKLSNVHTGQLLKGIFRFYGRFFLPMLLWGFVLFAFSLSVNQIPRLFPDSVFPVFISIGASVILFLLNICFFQYVINLAKTGNYSFENAFPSGGKFLRTIWGHMVYAFICFWYVLLFCIIFVAVFILGGVIQRAALNFMPDQMRIVNIILPLVGVVIGVILFVKLIKIAYERGFFLFFILDRDKNTKESFAASIRYARGIDNKSNFASYINVSFLIFVPLTVMMTLVLIKFFAPPAKALSPELLQQMGNVSLSANAVQFFFTNIIAAPLYYSMMTMMYFLMTGQPTVFSGKLTRFFKDPTGNNPPESLTGSVVPSTNSFSVPLEKMEADSNVIVENEKKDN